MVGVVKDENRRPRPGRIEGSSSGGEVEQQRRFLVGIRQWFFGSCFTRPSMLAASITVLLALGSGCVSTRTIREPVARSIKQWMTEEHLGREIITEHFRLFSTLKDRELEAALPDFLERCYEQYHSLVPFRSDPGVRLTTYLFGSRAEWIAFTRDRFPEQYEVYSRIDSGGFTQRDTAVVFVASRSHTFATLAHEGWHQYFAAHSDTQIPSWLNEGLACYHESVFIGPDGTQFTPKHNSFRLNSLRDALRARQILPLRELLNAKISTILQHQDQNMAYAYYAQVWALVTLLRHGNEIVPPDAFDAMIRDLCTDDFAVRVGAAVLSQRDRDNLTYAEAVLPTYFSASAEDLERIYRDHLYQLAGFKSP